MTVTVPLLDISTDTAVLVAIGVSARRCWAPMAAGRPR